MKFDKLKFNDRFSPVENVMVLIRNKTIENASICFHTDSAGGLFYEVGGEIPEENLHEMANLCKPRE